MTTKTTFLSSVPFPLLAPPSKIISADLQELPQIPHESQATLPFEIAHYQSLKESIVDLSDFPVTSRFSRETFCQEFGLQQLVGMLYHSAKEPSIALKIAALEQYLAPLRLPYIRVSRQTAAWVWGYLSGAPQIVHLDFEKSRRSETLSMKKRMVHAHQLNSFGPNDTNKIFEIEVTSKLRTVLDVMQYEEIQTSQTVTSAFLADASHEISRESLERIINFQKHIQHRERCLKILEKMV